MCFFGRLSVNLVVCVRFVSLFILLSVCMFLSRLSLSYIAILVVVHGLIVGIKPSTGYPKILAPSPVGYSYISQSGQKYWGYAMQYIYSLSSLSGGAPQIGDRVIVASSMAGTKTGTLR